MRTPGPFVRSVFLSLTKNVVTGVQDYVREKGVSMEVRHQHLLYKQSTTEHGTLRVGK